MSWFSKEELYVFPYNERLIKIYYIPTTVPSMKKFNV